MVTIRFTTTGTTNRRTYRIIAVEKRSKRDGRAIEYLGSYNPLVKPPEIIVKRERIDYWVQHGAQISPAVQKLLDRKP